MTVGFINKTGKSILVTFTTDLGLLILEKTLGVGGMWRMTFGTGIYCFTGQMAVSFGHFFGNCLMAFKAFIGGNRTITMAVSTPLLEGRVKDITNKSCPAAAVGIMTGQAVPYFRREAFVAGLHIFLVARTAEPIRLIFEQLDILRFVGLMAGTTLTVGKRSMGEFICLVQVFVAPETIFPQLTCTQQPFYGRGMRLVAGKTFTLPDRLVGQQ